MVARKPTSFDSHSSVDRFNKRPSVYIDPDSDLYAEIRYLQSIQKTQCISCVQIKRTSSTLSIDESDSEEGI
jgi:hypothetical protein